jgi:hypothetical protein
MNRIDYAKILYSKLYTKPYRIVNEQEALQITDNNLPQSETVYCYAGIMGIRYVVKEGKKYRYYHYIVLTDSWQGEEEPKELPLPCVD